MTTAQLSNAIARKYFYHAEDMKGTTDERVCFFSEGGNEEGWGFWVDAKGNVEIDHVSSSGKLPGRAIVDACRRAAIKYLKD